MPNVKFRMKVNAVVGPNRVTIPKGTIIEQSFEKMSKSLQDLYTAADLAIIEIIEETGFIKEEETPITDTIVSNQVPNPPEKRKAPPENAPSNDDVIPQAPLLEKKEDSSKSRKKIKKRSGK